MPEIHVDTEEIVRVWQDARKQLAGLLAQKQAAPLDPVRVPDSVRAAVRFHERNCAKIAALNELLTQGNQTIVAVKFRTPTEYPQRSRRFWLGYEL
jgi:hypothetical protein